MKYRKQFQRQLAGILFILVLLEKCSTPDKPQPPATSSADTDSAKPPPAADTLFTPPFNHDIRVREYFRVMDSLAAHYDSLTGDTLSEHILVAANPWIIDTLAATQYENFMKRDSFVYDQRDLIVIPKGKKLIIPSTEQVKKIMEDFAQTRVELNVPEYRLRVLKGNDTLLDASCRVGRNEKKYLALAGGSMWLKTDTGTGYIFRIERYPLFLNPVDGKKFELTKRDDYKTTKMPLIPWIEPSLNGTRYGDLIHPTTNPKTLGKAYSNGCIGLSEADTWRFYYLAPLNTKVHFYYDTEVVSAAGDTLRYKDIYNKKYAVIIEPKKPDTLSVVPADTARKTP